MVPQKILVRAPNWIGDQVLAYPFFYYLRKNYPHSKIVSVCVQWVSDLQYRNLVDEVHILSRPVSHSKWDRFWHLESEARELRKKGPWDLAISLPNSFSSAWLIYRAHALFRRGYEFEGRKFLLNDSLPWREAASLHRAQAYLRLLPTGTHPQLDAGEFWGKAAENPLDPKIPGVEEYFDFARSWRPKESIVPPREPYWVLAPGATAESRRWPSRFFIELARMIRTETGLRGIVVGGPSEAPLASEICRDSTLGLRDLTAQCSVNGLVPLFARANFTVTNESGLAHVASLSGSFVQIVCGAADPRRTRPVGPGRVQVAINPIECWPCERNTCSRPEGQRLACLLGIEPELVWEEIKRGLKAQRDAQAATH